MNDIILSLHYYANVIKMQIITSKLVYIYLELTKKKKKITTLTMFKNKKFN